MDHLPNNGWPFGSTMNDTIPVPIQPLTTEQIHNWSAELPSNTGENVRVHFNADKR